jgi:hypothetical protein
LASNIAAGTSAPIPTEPTAENSPTLAGPTEYAAIGGLATTPPGPLTPGQRMQQSGSTAYRGLIVVAQALSDCSDIFLPLKTACNVILTLHKTFDVSDNYSFSIRNYSFVWFAEGVDE